MAQAKTKVRQFAFELRDDGTTLRVDIPLKESPGRTKKGEGPNKLLATTGSFIPTGLLDADGDPIRFSGNVISPAE